MMSTTKTLWLSLMIPLGAVIATAQQPTCSVKLDQLAEAPELRGFSLGMTYEQVKARVPQVRFPPPDQFGVAKTTINPSYDPSFDQSSFEGVRSISMDFLDGKLVTLWIGYNESFKWQKLDELVAGISKALNLPALWPSKGRGQELTCADFSAFASMITGSPALRITNEAARETIGMRRADAEAAAEAAKATAEAVVIGDQRTKLYYPNDCDQLDEVSEINRVTFKDRDEAEKAGYKRAKDCP
jgi:hypothetical protein